MHGAVLEYCMTVGSTRRPHESWLMSFCCILIATVVLITEQYELGGGTIKRQPLNSEWSSWLTKTEGQLRLLNSFLTWIGTKIKQPFSETIGRGAAPYEGVSTEEMLGMIGSCNSKTVRAELRPPAAATHWILSTTVGVDSLSIICLFTTKVAEFASRASFWLN